MKRIALVGVVLGAVLAVPTAALATLETPLPRPDRDAPEIIVTAGTYSQEQTVANRSTYLALQDYADQRNRILDEVDAAAHARNDYLLGVIRQRDVDTVAALNARQATIDSQAALLVKRAAKIRALRKIIRDLRDQ